VPFVPPPFDAVDVVVAPSEAVLPVVALAVVVLPVVSAPVVAVVPAVSSGVAGVTAPPPDFNLSWIGEGEAVCGGEMCSITPTESRTMNPTR
jgi:hypothetical protein